MSIAPGQEDTGERLEEAENTAATDGAVAIKGRTPWEIVRSRLLRDKVTMVALVVSVLVILLGAIAAPLLQAAGVLRPDLPHNELVTGLGSIPESFGGGMSWAHPLGVEPGTGRDLMSRIIAGLTTSLIVAVSATVFSVILGTVLGIVSGFAGGVTDWFISRFMDLVLSFPSILMLISLQSVLVPLVGNAIHKSSTDPVTKIVFMIVVLGWFGFPFFARIIRGQVLTLREREFVEAARSLGAKNGRIYFKELLPHLWAPLLVYTTLIMPANIAAEASLGYLGVGINPPTASLGAILSDSVNYTQADFAYFLYPGLMVVIIVLALNLLGDGLRDALDPKAGRS